MPITLSGLRNQAPLFALVVLFALIAGYDPRFIQPASILALLADTATLFIMAAGITFVLLIGGIDLSSQAVASMASVIVALLLPELGYLALPLGLAIGIAAGALSGVLHTWLRLPSFIVTLAVGGVVTTITMLASQTRTINISGTDRDAYFAWVTGQTWGIPHEVLVALVVLLACVFLQRKTAFGRFCNAVGAGEPAAWASGIAVKRIKLWVFVISAGLAALSGIVMAGRLSSGSPTLANEFLLPAIAAVLVGGTALTGGVGGIWRTLIGALLVSVVRVGMTFVGVSVFAQQIVFGVILVLAVALTIDRSKIPVVK
ncbi:ABC transporter permease [Pseudomonas daroniae]|uniref:ABC transporter permease n=1 Tax=Phytopseudomonas daroniae TaxID=2487519 RepID=A0A4Q9QHT2_9GAMM|nr:MULTISPECIES: ABC transporter permease [Pseudomonas]TBU73417.1 ABC transporter permease [Pseudomonas daroniae]TBU79169.1 ABC transporter permease [Pseudomonas sp. FRB 228]TBU88067.1 ABC transporter permease [Pseudomonas daroniae]